MEREEKGLQEKSIVSGGVLKRGSCKTTKVLTRGLSGGKEHRKRKSGESARGGDSFQ